MISFKKNFSFRNKKILIFGLGIQGGGAGAAKFFLKHGAEVKVTDLKTEKELSRSLRLLRKYPIKYTLGRHDEKDFLWADLVIRNPDVSLSSSYLQFCFKNRIPVEMEESLFMKLCQVKVIGVTGTRGKSTTTTLIGEILKTAGFPTLLGGNLRGISTLSLLDKIKKDSIVVLELSSWQLQSFAWDKISLQIAVITNVYPDHLNRYRGMEEYIADKKNIFKFQKRDDYLVLNSDNEITKSFKKEAKAKVVFFSRNTVPEEIKKSFPLSGVHNLENLAAAYTVAKIFKISDEMIKKAVRSFKTLPFRQEVVRILNKVTYINDSCSTTPISGIMALKRFKKQPIILICGGNSKNLPMEEFINAVNKNVKAVVLLEGTATDEIELGIKNYELRGKRKIIIGKFSDLKKAVLTAKREAKPGDVILFSPAATSFLMFKNEFDRGKKFSKIVKSL